MTLKHYSAATEYDSPSPYAHMVEDPNGSYIDFDALTNLVMDHIENAPNKDAAIAYGKLLDAIHKKED